MSFFGNISNKRKEKGSGKFKPKLIGSLIGSVFCGAIALYSGINILTGNMNVLEGEAYDIKADFYILIFSVGFLIGFAYWGIANTIEHKKVKAERLRKKQKKSNQHKKGGKMT